MQRKEGEGRFGGTQPPLLVGPIALRPPQALAVGATRRGRPCFPLKPVGKNPQIFKLILTINTLYEQLKRCQKSTQNKLKFLPKKKGVFSCNAAASKRSYRRGLPLETERGEGEEEEEGRPSGPFVRKWERRRRRRRRKEAPPVMPNK